MRTKQLSLIIPQATLTFRGKQYTKAEITALAGAARAAFSKAIVLRGIIAEVVSVQELQKTYRWFSEQLRQEWSRDYEVIGVLTGGASPVLHDREADQGFKTGLRLMQTVGARAH